MAELAGKLLIFCMKEQNADDTTNSIYYILFDFLALLFTIFHHLAGVSEFICLGDSIDFGCTSSPLIES